MGIHPWVDNGHFLQTFWSGRDALCFVPLLFGGRHFCTNAHGIRWTIRAIFVKFSQSPLLKNIKIVATRCQTLRIQCTKFNFGWALLQTLLGELTALLFSCGSTATQLQALRKHSPNDSRISAFTIDRHNVVLLYRLRRQRNVFRQYVRTASIHSNHKCD